VRITDFGLALSSDDASGRSEIAGTPAYMAPEQIGKGEASVRSDIYSLGLVIYELFTGRLPYQATTLIEWRRAHLESSPRTPSSVVKDIDPVVESAILHCLQKDPARRPSSVRQVAAAFPGGDPLAAALAAGETPSPEMVAASGESEGLHPLVAWLVLAGVVASVTAVILLGAQTKLFRRVPLEKPPEALAERARDILQSAGYSEPPADTAMGFYEGDEFLSYITAHDKSKTRWDNLETGAFVFWYRGSPRPLAAHFSFLFTDAPMLGAVWTYDPALQQSGMTLVKLNPLGRLTQFVAVPPQVEKPADAASSPPDWAPLFSAAGLDSAKWQAARPSWTPPVYSDARAAWTGSLVQRPEIPMRIEAAAYRGKPVFFELIGPWARPERMQPYQESAGTRVQCSRGATCALTEGIAGGRFVWHLLFSRLGRWRGFLARIISRTPANLGFSWSFWLGGLAGPVFCGFSTLRWSPMCAAAGPPCWSPGAGYWQGVFAIRWSGAISLPVAFWPRLPAPPQDWCGLFSSGAVILRRNSSRVHNGSFWARGRSSLI
jgi:serine/threonine-protein kinase